MKSLLLPAFLVLWAAFPAVAEDRGGTPINHQYIVVLQDSAEPSAASAALSQAHGIAVMHVFHRALSGFSALIPPARLEAVQNDPLVKSLSPDWTLRATGKGFSAADAGGNTAVLDTGIDSTRSELAETVAGGVTLVTSEESPTPGGQDDNGHGTSVAENVVRSAPSAALWSVKVLNRSGAGSFSDLIAGIDWLLDTSAHPAIDLATLNLGATCPDCTGDSEHPTVIALKEAVRSAKSRGIMLVSDTGDADARTTVPAAFEEVAAAVSAGPAQSKTAPAFSGADPTFKLGEVYAYPNPARAGAKPVIHMEVGIADQVRLQIFDVTGRRVHEATLEGTPPIIDDGQGPQYAYEYIWEGHIASGIYLFVMRAEKGGSAALIGTGKLAVVR